MPNHPNGLPLAVSVVIINGTTGAVLAVARKFDDKQFGLPGGKVDPTDYHTPDDPFDMACRRAARREVQEELGITVFYADMEPVLSAVCRDDTGRDPDYWTMTFLATSFSGDPTRQVGEGVVAWVPWETIFKGPFGTYNGDVYESLRMQGKL